MSQAAKFFDVVLGIDLHKVVIPGPPGQIPLPHPFIGIVWDPMGVAIGALLGIHDIHELDAQLALRALGGNGSTIDGDRDAAYRCNRFLAST